MIFTYKTIIKNMVEISVEKEIKTKINNPDLGIMIRDVKLEAGNKEFEFPSFSLEADIAEFIYLTGRKYQIHGYVDCIGNVEITSCQFNRGNEEFFLFGEKLQNFQFDI